MPYSSFSPNEERFGFNIKSSFRCAYENERLIVIAFLIAIGAILVGMIICFATCYEMLFTPVDINAAATGKRANIFGFNPAEYGLSAMAMVFLFWLAIVAAIAFCIVLSILHSGRCCDFKANENYMEIITQEKYPHTYVIYYNDVIDVTASERKILFLSGLDINVRTKKKTFLFRFIHTHMSKTEGLAGTPFNIICERAGIVSKPKYMQ